MMETASIDGLQIHGGANGYRLLSFTIGSPAPRAVTANRPNAHGTTDVTQFYGPRPVELVGLVQADDWATLWARLDELKGKLALGFRTLTFRREGLTFDEQVRARIDSPVDVPLTGRPIPPTVRYGCSLVAPDPRLYSATLNTNAYDPTDAGSGGLVFPLTFPLDFQASDTAGRLPVDNEGSISTPPVFVITGPVTNPIIDNETTGESLRTQGLELAAGDTLTIDVATRAVTLNGSTSRPDLVSGAQSDWPEIAPGVNQLRLRGSGMVSTQTELSVSYRNARI